MVKYVISILLFLSIISCGSSNDFNKIILKKPDLPDKNWNEELVSYINEFLNYVKKYEVKTTPINELRIVKYGKPDKELTILGVCNVYIYEDKTTYREIIVRKEKHDVWFKQLMFHELGHCLLNLEHTDNKSDIMYPYRNKEQIINFKANVERMFINKKGGGLWLY